MVYTAESRSLAALEMLVHVENEEIMEAFSLIPVSIPSSCIQSVPPDALPRHWDSREPTAVTKKIGDKWILGGSSAVLEVPSVITRSERNYLLNPEHHDFTQLEIGEPEPFYFDPRLF